MWFCASAALSGDRKIFAEGMGPPAWSVDFVCNAANHEVMARTTVYYDATPLARDHAARRQSDLHTDAALMAVRREPDNIEMYRSYE